MELATSIRLLCKNDQVKFELSFACSKRQSLPLGRLDQFHIQAWCPRKTGLRIICAFSSTYFRGLGNVHSEILQYIQMIFDASFLSSIINISATKLVINGTIFQDMVHNGK